MKNKLMFCAVTVSACLLGQPVPGTISTFAGNGRAPFVDDGKKAFEAQLYDIFQIAIDGADNLYFTDYYYNQVFKITTNGTLNAIAGTGEFGISGDGGSATKALLYGPRALAAAKDGTVYFSDVLNNRIRKITSSGIITTAVGGGDFNGTGVQGPEAMLHCPESLALSGAGYLGFLTQCDLRFQVMYPAGLLYTYGGNGTPGPIADGGVAYRGALGRTLTGIAVDTSANANWFISVDNRIRRVDGATYVITTIGGGDEAGFSGDGGPATAAKFNTPYRLAVDKTGAVYVPDRLNHRIRKIDAKGIVTTIAGNGVGKFGGEDIPATDSPIALPSSVAFDSAGAVYFSEQGSRRIRKIQANGKIVTVAGRGIPDVGDGGSASSSLLINPYGIAVGPDGSVYLADKDDHRIRRIDPNGLITTIAGIGIAGYSGDGGPALQAQFDSPVALAVDQSGNVFVSDSGNHAIRRIASDGQISTVAGTGGPGFSGDEDQATKAQLNSPDGLCLDPDGKLYIADYLNHRVRMVDTDGTIHTVAGDGTFVNPVDGGGANESSVGAPTDVLYDASSASLYIVSRAASTIRVLTADGLLNTVAGKGAATLADGTNDLAGAYALAQDGLGNIFISEESGIVKILSKGVLGTVIGNSGDFFGDGGFASTAAVNNPRHIAVLPDGSLLVADAANKRIRKVTFTQLEANRQ